ncbi:hypothetical protein [Plantactinospora sp. KLBMP9567]|uniref:hypothetical protein n=1 Tax=Plantactinospora sp. KLBMP9567 TaxID=3085900 RepID=UPI002981DF8D|nr:hypothetical protein [Plantactinospora sp. KLBMP9567]MDW5325342.1 hypothetical protein [Plantactinospora sp. KLBMP9567]
MAPGYPAHAGVTETASPFGRGTVPAATSATDGPSDAVTSFATVADASLSLGHRTYSGTVATTERLP